jgi:hypothetical protein
VKNIKPSAKIAVKIVINLSTRSFELTLAKMIMANVGSRGCGNECQVQNDCSGPVRGERIAVCVMGTWHFGATGSVPDALNVFLVEWKGWTLYGGGRRKV